MVEITEFLFPLFCVCRLKEEEIYFRVLIIQLLKQTVFFIFANVFEKKRAFD